MKRTDHRPYKPRSTFEIILKAAGWLILVCAVITVVLFFVIRQYVVYTPDGIVLDIPWR